MAPKKANTKRGRTSIAPDATAARSLPKEPRLPPRVHPTEPKSPVKRRSTIVTVMKPIVDTIEMAQDLPEDCRNMLVVGLPSSLGVPSDERMKPQVEIVAMVGEVLEDVRRRAESGVDAAAARLVEMESSKGVLEKNAADAEAALAKAEASLTEKTETYSNSNNALSAAKAAFAERTSEQKQGDVDLVKAKSDKASYEELLVGPLVVLRDGTWEKKPEMQKLYKQMTPLVNALKLDDSLMTALPGAIAKKLVDRGSFERVVVDTFAKSLEDKVAALASVLEDGALAAAERAAKVEAAQKQVDFSTEANDQAAKEVSEAKEAKKQAQVALASTKTDLANSQPSIDSAARFMAKKRVDADSLKIILDHFYELRDRTAAKLAEGASVRPDEEASLAKKAKSQYTQIGNARYERELLEIAEEEEAKAHGGAITPEAAARLFTAAMDGPGVTPTEKRTLKYIVKSKNLSEQAKAYLETKMCTSWYLQIEGVPYERVLLTIAADAQKPIDEASAVKLWASAVDGNQVTACEKRSLEYLLAKEEFSEDARSFLDGKLKEVELWEE